MKNKIKNLIGVSLAILLGISINFNSGFNEAMAQEAEISDGNSCFTRLINRPNQSSLVCSGNASGTCQWSSGKGKDRSECPTDIIYT